MTKKSKYLIAITILICIILLTIGLYLSFSDNKKISNNNNNNDINSNTNTNNNTNTTTDTSILNKIQILQTPNDAQAVELIKKNIVKITNKINDKTIINGTGFFNEDGYLITCSHVVDRKGEIEIEYYDKTKAKATLISNDITSDIAILSVENPKTLAMSFGSTLNLKVTDTIFAVGYPYDLEGESSVFKGILSARRSKVGIEYLQSDLSLNEGMSGGPLINSKAELIGINALANNNSTIGMSISSESLENIIYKLTINKKVTYVEKERENNALSTILKEVGHKHEDIYNEKHLYKKEEDKKEENKKEETTPVTKKSNNANLKKFEIVGYTFSPIFTSGNPGEYNVTLKGGVKDINVKVETSDPKAKYQIIGNTKNLKSGHNEIRIKVTAEDGTIKEYFVSVKVRDNSSKSIKKIEFNVEKERCQKLNGNCLSFYLMYYDHDGINLDTSQYDFISNMTIDTYVIHNKYDENGKQIETYLTSINNPTAISNLERYEFLISKIKDLLKDSDYYDYYGNEEKTALVKIVLKINTVDNNHFESNTLIEF